VRAIMGSIPKMEKPNRVGVDKHMREIASLQ
jgi:hypothetical protein